MSARPLAKRSAAPGALDTLAPMRRRPRSTTVLTATLTTPVPAAATQARETRDRRAVDLRYPFMPGGPSTFGLFKPRVTGGTCATARRVAQAWMRAFEAHIARGTAKLSRGAAGFAFTTLPATEAQTYRERGRRGPTSIRLDYRVPNG
ncbi:MAG: hypothetical protein QOJ35_3146 [Solirubrobacteraceae bacterium]|nr:hypothetical protein [Solirubrobacteraceae bacterium]